MNQQNIIMFNAKTAGFFENNQSVMLTNLLRDVPDENASYLLSVTPPTAPRITKKRNRGGLALFFGVLIALISIASYSEYQRYKKAIDWHEPEFAKSYVSLAQKEKVEFGISAFIALILVGVGACTLSAPTDLIQKEYNYQFYLDQITKLK